MTRFPPAQDREVKPWPGSASLRPAARRGSLTPDLCIVAVVAGRIKPCRGGARRAGGGHPPRVPVRLEELLPGGPPLPLTNRLDPVLTENAADGGVGDLVPEVGEPVLDAVVAPGWILPGHAQDQLDDLRLYARTSDRAPALAVVPLLGHELPVPAEDGVGREGGTDLAEHLPSEHPAFDRQAPPLVAVELDPTLAVRLLQHLVLGAKILEVISCCCRLTRPARIVGGGARAGG